MLSKTNREKKAFPKNQANDTDGGRSEKTTFEN